MFTSLTKLGCYTTSQALYHSFSSANDHVNPLGPHDALKHPFYIPENRLNFPTTMVFRTDISMKQVYRYMAIIFNFLSTSNHFYPLQVENCDSNSRLVVDEDDKRIFRLERVNFVKMVCCYS